jgi:hypothetical protein
MHKFFSHFDTFPNEIVSRSINPWLRLVCLKCEAVFCAPIFDDMLYNILST